MNSKLRTKNTRSKGTPSETIMPKSFGSSMDINPRSLVIQTTGTRQS